MTVLYSNDFELGTHANGIAAFTNRSGAFIILNKPNFASAPVVRGNKCFAAADAGDIAYYNGNTALGNQAIRTAEKVASFSHRVGHILRNPAGSENGCWCGWDESGGNLRAHIEVYSDGRISYDATAYNIPVAVGDVVHMESRAVGTTLEVRLWTNSNERPATATLSVTSSQFATGAVALKKVGGSQVYAAVDDLVITDAAGGENYFYPPAPSITTQPSNQTVTAGATATFTLAATASAGGLTYQWERNTVGIGGATSASYTTPATTVSGGTANNGDTYRCVVTDSNGSTTSNSATLTVNAAADTTPPTLTGTITVGTVTANSIQISWPAGSDNVAVTAYETSPDGTTWTSRGNVLTYTFTGLTASTSYTLRVRAKDAAGNTSTPVLSVTQSTSAAVTATLTTPPIVNNTGTLLASSSGWTVNVYNVSTGALVVQKTAQSTNASGVIVVTDAALVSGTTYSYECVHATHGRRLPVATA